MNKKTTILFMLFIALTFNVMTGVKAYGSAWWDNNVLHSYDSNYSHQASSLTYNGNVYTAQ